MVTCACAWRPSACSRSCLSSTFDLAIQHLSTQPAQPSVPQQSAVETTEAVDAALPKLKLVHHATLESRDSKQVRAPASRSRSLTRHQTEHAASQAIQNVGRCTTASIAHVTQLLPERPSHHHHDHHHHHHHHDQSTRPLAAAAPHEVFVPRPSGAPEELFVPSALNPFAGVAMSPIAMMDADFDLPPPASELPDPDLQDLLL